MSVTSPASHGGLAERFYAIDWSFRDSDRDPVHDVHPYPARFIREIPAAALDLAPSRGLVVDPYCGAGTTPVEAVRKERPALAIDLNPIATLITRAKLSGWTSEDSELLPAHRHALLSSAISGHAKTLERARAEIPRVDHWFSEVAQRLLAGATSYIQGLEDSDPWKVRLSCALSSVVVQISRQESDTRYAAIDKAVDVERALNVLGRAVDRVADAAWRLSAETRDQIHARVITGDAADLSTCLTEDVAAAVFSPPYPNAYEYWLYHKYRMYWLGFDPIAVRSSEIGARPFYSGSGKLTERDFGAQVRPVFRALSERLVPAGIVLVVVGDSVIRGRYVDNGELLTQIAAEEGLGLVGSTHRMIRTTRRSFNLAVARARSEHVLLFSSG